MIQSRRAFIRSCGILLAAAIATPAMGTSVAAGAAELGRAINSRIVLQETMDFLMEAHIDGVRRRLYRRFVVDTDPVYWQDLLEPTQHEEELKDG